MLKYIIALIFLILAGIGLKYSRTSSELNLKNINLYTVPIQGKNQKLNDLEKSLVGQEIKGFNISRSGTDLTVTTQVGKNFSFKDFKSDTGFEFSYVVEFRANPEVLAIYTEAAETKKFTYLLSTGNEIPANHYLYPSPSGLRAVQISSPDQKSEPAQKYDFVGWSILEKDGEIFKEAGKQSPIEFKDFNNVGLRFSNWDGEDSIDVIIKYSTTQKAEFVTLCVPGKLELIDDKWTLSAELEGAEQDCSEFKTLMAPDPIKELL